jgi:hypothetical protein
MTARIKIVLLALFIIPMILSFFPHRYWWGLALAGAFPIWLRLVLSALFILSFAPGISDRLARWTERALNENDRAKSIAIFSLLSICMLALFVIFPEKNYLLGDGYNILGNIESGHKFSPTEPLDYLLHHRLYSLTSGGREGAVFAYALSSYLAGMIFLAGLFIYVKNKSFLIPALALALGFGAIQFFFGYAESYTFAFVFSFLYALSARDDINRERLSLMTVVWIILAVGFHLMSAVFLPSLAYLFFMRVKSGRTRIIVLWSLALPAVLGLIFIGRYLSLKQIYVPIQPTADNPYHLFSGAHIRDILNIFWINYPLAFLTPFLWKSLPPGEKRLFLWAIIPALLFTIIVDPKIGAFRDWDLLAVAAAPVMVLLFALFEKYRADYGRSALIAPTAALFIFAFWHTGSFVWKNSFRDENYPLFKEMIRNDLHYSTEYYSGYRNRPWGILAKNEYGDAAEADRAWTVRYQGDSTDNTNTINLSKLKLQEGDTAAAISLLRRGWPHWVEDREAMAATVSILGAARAFRDVEQVYAALINLGRADITLLYDMGVIKKELGEIDSSFYYFDLVFRSSPSAPVDQAYKFYAKAYHQGQYQIARDGLNRILPDLNDADRAAARAILDSLETMKTK